MQVEPEDRHATEAHRSGLPKLPVALGILIVIIAIAWFIVPEPPEQEVSAPPGIVKPYTPKTPPAPRPPAPDIPIQQLDEPEIVAEAEPAAPEMTLADSDETVRQLATPALQDTVFAQALLQDDLLERSAALFDAAGNGAVLREVLPFPPPEGEFAVTQVDGKLITDPQSFERYDPYAAAVSALDTAMLADTFHRFRPLLEQAYGNLGYRPEDMDNALIRALDQLLATPTLEQPAELVKDVNTYSYRDPSLENLPPLAKQLLRMGPDNQAIIQQQAGALRAALLTD